MKAKHTKEREVKHHCLKWWNGIGERCPVQCEDCIKDDDPYKNVTEMYSATHEISIIPGTECNLSHLKDNESVCFGDGLTYHFKLTKRL